MARARVGQGKGSKFPKQVFASLFQDAFVHRPILLGSSRGFLLLSEVNRGKEGCVGTIGTVVEKKNHKMIG